MTTDPRVPRRSRHDEPPDPQSRPDAHAAVDPTSLPDPEDITEADLPEPPPRPGRESRRFAGTQQQIRSATRFYVVCAWITGVMLLLLVAEMVFKYGLHQELFAGGTTVDGEPNVLGLHPEDSVTGGVNLSLLILIAHGWMYGSTSSRASACGPSCAGSRCACWRWRAVASCPSSPSSWRSA